MGSNLMSERIGIFGGTFDPIHHGHLIIASELKFQLQLDRLFFLPAGIPPHKTNLTISSNEDRLNMLEMVLQNDPNFEISYVDIENQGLSYTAESMRQHQQRFAEAELHFLMGQDSFRDLPHWHNPGEITKLVRLGVALRPGVVVDIEHIYQQVPEAEGRVDFVDVPLIQIASSEIRRRVRSNEPIRYHVPHNVETYIREHRLYTPEHGDERF
jgi:nicotinate-nucleotide adenylyltransferase